MKIIQCGPKLKQCLALLCGLFLLAGVQARADDSGKYILESLGGTEKLATVESGGTSRKAVEGMELHPGDRLKTGYRTSAKVVYPDGTKVIIGRLSDVKIGEKTGDIQYNDVEAGEMRAVVAKPPKGDDSAKKIKFLIRTKTVVMGVRGTDFLFRHDSKRLVSEVYTFEGKLDLSRSEADLRAGKGISVGMGYVGTATTKQITVKPFEPRPFLVGLNKEEPELLKQARSDSQVFREDYVVPFKTGMQWLNFQLNGLYAKDTSSSGQSFSGELSWNPEYLLNSRFSLRGQLGWFLLKGNSGNTFVGYELAPLLAIKLNPAFAIEAGAGAESWLSGNGNLGLVVLGNLVWRLQDWGWLDRLFVGFSDYTGAPTASGGTSSVLQFKLGAGVSF